jgi:hypothetical protein
MKSCGGLSDSSGSEYRDVVDDGVSVAVDFALFPTGAVPFDLVFAIELAQVVQDTSIQGTRHEHG